MSNFFTPQARYKKNDYIIRQGAKGVTFYIIRKGIVRVTIKDPDNHNDGEKFVRFMERGSSFGEKALTSDEVRTANVIAESDEVDCLVMDRE